MPSKYLRVAKDVQQASPANPSIQTAARTMSAPADAGMVPPVPGTVSVGTNETDGTKIPVSTMMPAAQRDYAVFRRIDPQGYISDKEYVHICKLVCGDRRRLFQRVLLGLYQRAHLKKAVEDVSRFRMLLSLHEGGTQIDGLESYL